MRWIAWPLLLYAALADPGPGGRVIEVSTADGFADALRAPLEDVMVVLAPGVYDLVPDGVRVSGRDVQLVGDGGADRVTIVAHAGRGLYFEDCVDCVVDAVTITGATRDGSVLAVNSSAWIVNCVIRDTGTEGIVAGKQTLLTIENCEILRNASDGISICDDAHAIIRNNLIEANHRAVFIDCDAQAIVERNHMRECNTGIAIAGRANVEARFNIVEDMKSSGIECVASTPAMPVVAIEDNAVYRCDVMGVLIAGPAGVGHASGRLAGNLVVGTGTREADHRARGSLVLENVPDGFVIRNNTCYGNVETPDSPDRDVPRERFSRERLPWTRTHRNTAVGVDGRHKFHESAYLTRYGKWLR